MSSSFEEVSRAMHRRTDMASLFALQGERPVPVGPYGSRRGSVAGRPERTTRRPVSIGGVGLHGGAAATVTIRPAPHGSGVRFRRTDLGADATLPASFDRVVDTRLCTVLADQARPELRVGTVEHLMAAIVAHGIDDLLIEVDGPELPILDGSARPYVLLLERAGRAVGRRGATAIAVRRPVRVEEAGASASLLPAAAFSLDVSIDFAAAAIGRQSLVLDRLTPERFRSELAGARTFALLDEIAALREAGLARGGSLDNAVVVDNDRVLNPSGLRMRHEFVRHKALDAVGDLRLAGAPLIGRFVAHRPGHGLNNRVLRALFADERNWERVPLETEPADDHPADDHSVDAA